MSNILHVMSGDLWAGAEVMVCHLLKALRRFDELNIRVVLLNEGRLSKEVRNLGIKIYVVDERRNSLPSILRRMREIVREEKPNIIHSHGYKQNILCYLISKSVSAVKLVGTQHGMPESHGKGYDLRHRLITTCNLFCLSRFHRVVAVSREIKEAFIRRHAFKQDKVSVIHNGIEIPAPTFLRENSEHFVIGSSGRLFPVKDYAFMIEIARTVLRRKNQVRFQLAGDGPEKRALKALTSRYHLDDVFTFRGHLDDISPFYQGLDLYLNTSIHEGIPISILEAMAHQLPVVGPRVGGLPEMIEEGVQGYLLQERIPEYFAEKCLFLQENKSQRNKMAKAGRKKVEQEFSMEQMAQNYFNLYSDLVQD